MPYTVTITNLGFNADTLRADGNEHVDDDVLRLDVHDADDDDADASRPATRVDVCVKVAVPGGAANGATNTGTVTATSAG